MATLQKGFGMPSGAYIAGILKDIAPSAIGAMHNGQAMDPDVLRKSSQPTLSPKARQDFIDILRYTCETWGEKQLLTHL